MKNYEKAIWAVLLALLLTALGAVVFTRSWTDYRERLRAIRQSSRSAQNPVDTHALDTAQQLAPLAITHLEQDYATQALRLGDHSVDLAFSAALHDAAENPTPLTPQAQQLAARVKSLKDAVAADQARIDQFTALAGHAAGSAKDDLQTLVGIAQAQIALDQDDLEDAQQELVRAGGDRQAMIQQLIDQRKATGSNDAALRVGPPAGAAPSIELTQSRSIAADVRAWMSLQSKEKLLAQARADANSRGAALSDRHAAIEKELEEGKSPAPNSPAAGAPDGAEAPAETPLARLKRQTDDKKNLADIGKRIETEQQLAGVYANWADVVDARAKGFLHEIFLSVFWVLLIGAVVLALNELVQRLFAGVSLERREMHTMRALTLFALQAIGLLSILLVAFGMPTNLATVLALAGAGLTVAMKDFIVGFFGWFVLMGKDGIRAGDWVEINGVGGEVLKVGLLHTVILETGNWTDAGHPTGRKVSFVNSFAIEGHYFNFSTSGQWLWDEIEVQVPESADPYATSEAMRKIAAEETAANAQVAENEWNGVARSYEKRAFSAAPSLSVRPNPMGIAVVLRYIARANERFETRARIYRAVVDVLRKPQGPEPAAPKAARSKP
ncbi:MAG TPA: mechanosensitive ion channel domain-containing protein [Bryobacteraceae bacterium]|nr:mechanosensitive ion channel domain-containing protein [Bryobacteraceae bacterium]